VLPGGATPVVEPADNTLPELRFLPTRGIRQHDAEGTWPTGAKTPLDPVTDFRHLGRLRMQIVSICHDSHRIPIINRGIIGKPGSFRSEN
jgi:hypothetical protein